MITNYSKIIRNRPSLSQNCNRELLKNCNRKIIEAVIPLFQIDSGAQSTAHGLMRRYYFHTEVLELRRSMIVLEKNTLLRVTYAIIVYTNTRLDSSDTIWSSRMFSSLTRSTFKLKQNKIRSNKHEQDNTNDHLQN